MKMVTDLLIVHLSKIVSAFGLSHDMKSAEVEL